MRPVAFLATAALVVVVVVLVALVEDFDRVALSAVVVVAGTVVANDD